MRSKTLMPLLALSLWTCAAGAADGAAAWVREYPQSDGSAGPQLRHLSRGGSDPGGPPRDHGQDHRALGALGEPRAAARSGQGREVAAAQLPLDPGPRVHRR